MLSKIAVGRRSDDALSHVAVHIGVGLAIRSIHLKRRNTIYHWRRRVPLSLVPLLGRTEISVSLHTGRARIAALRAHQLTARTDKLFDMLTTAANPQDIIDFARTFLDDILDEAETAYTITGPITADIIESKRSRARKMEYDARQALVTNDLRQADGLVKRLVDQQGINIEPGTPDHDLLRRHLLRALVEGAVAFQARHCDGRYDHQPVDPLFKPAQAIPAPRQRRDGPKLSDVIEKHLVTKTRLNTAQTVAQDTRTLGFLVGWMNDCVFANVDMGTHVERPQFLDEIGGILAPVGTQGDCAWPVTQRLDHVQRRQTLGMAGDTVQPCIDDQTRAVLHQAMADEAQPSLHARLLAVQHGSGSVVLSWSRWTVAEIGRGIAPAALAIITLGALRRGPASITVPSIIDAKTENEALHQRLRADRPPEQNVIELCVSIG